MTMAKPKHTLPASVAAAARADAAQATANNPRIDAVRGLAKDALDLELELADLEARAAEKAEKLNLLYHQSLPDAMDQAGVLSVDLDAQGNAPACTLKVEPFYRASISSKWPYERQRAAYAEVADKGGAAIIKCTVSVAFDKQDRPKAQKLQKRLEGMGFNPKLFENVHHMTLTSWLSEEYPRRAQSGEPQVDLEKIGAVAGRIARLKPKDPNKLKTREQRKPKEY